MTHTNRSFPAAAIAACVALTFSPIAFSQKANETINMKGRDGVTGPRVLSKVDPDYTQDATTAKISGTVLLNLVVGSDGVARDIKVTRSLDPGLDANAITAVQQWKFQPGTKDGLAVDVKANIEVNFRLK